MKSIFQPWDLRFRTEYEAIAAESQQVRELADATLKAEDTRLEVMQGTKHWEQVVRQISDLRAENQGLADLFSAKLGMMESSMFCMSMVTMLCCLLDSIP